MAGVKGRSGGKRLNAGRKRKTDSNQRVAEGAAAGAESNSQDPVLGSNGQPAAGRREPLAFLEDVLNMPGAPLKDRIRAAIAAAQYRHVKRADGGKRTGDADKAKQAASKGKYAAAAAPLSLVKR